MKKSTITCYNGDKPQKYYAKWEKSDTQGYLSYDSFIGKIQNSWVHRDRRKIGGCQGMGKRRMESDYLMNPDFFFWDDENWELDSGGGI